MIFPSNWRELISKVNFDVNALTFESDEAQYGEIERWEDITDTGKEDCDGYAIGKLRRLFKLGYPIEALRLATCQMAYPATGGHAVLEVQTPEGFVILSNGLPVMTRGAFFAKGFKPLNIQVVGGKQEWGAWTVHLKLHA